MSESENKDTKQLLNEWKSILQTDIEKFQGYIDIQIELKQKKEAKLTKQLHPILGKIATHQRRIDDIKYKMLEIDKELENQNESNT